MSLILEKCVKHWLKTAIDATKDPSKIGRMLTIKEFIQYTYFKVDTFAMNKFYYNLNNDLFIYVDESIIKWFGYKGSIRHQKEQIRKILQTNFLEYKDIYWFEYSNKEYENFYNEKSMPVMTGMENINKSQIKIYPDPVDFKYKNQTKHMIVHPDIFKHIVLMADTQNSMNIRDYYITLEELIKKYSQYQTEAIKNENMSLLQTLKETNNLMIVNEKKADDERKKADERDKIQSANIDRLLGYATETNETLKVVAKNHVEVNKLTKNQQCKLVILKDSTDNELPFNVIRRQNISIESTIKEHKEKYDVDLTIWFELEQPNAMAFYNIIKKELKEYMNISGFWFGLKNITEEEFKQKIYDINKRRTRN